jgi:ubiquinone/menaquinone biosynthesis C-methylase UbiE
MDPNEDFKIRDAESYNSVVENFDQLTENYSTYIVDTLLDRLGSSPGARLLDIGCGTGLVSLGAARHFDGKTKVTGIDLSDEMLKFARRKAEKTGLAPIRSSSKATLKN